jgi:hypothetical protein
MPDKMAYAFERQKTEARNHIKRLEQIRSLLPDEQVYNRMSLDLRLRQLTSVLDWLDECQKNFHQS